MSPTNRVKIDKFYFAFFVIMVVLTGVVIMTFKTIFSSMIVAFNVENYDLNAELKIDKDRLNTTYDIVYNKAPVSLEIKD